MILFLEKDEYVSGITEGSGVVIDVHPFKTMAFPEHNGISVAPGTTTNVAMRMVSQLICDAKANDSNCVLEKVVVTFVRRTDLTNHLNPQDA